MSWLGQTFIAVPNYYIQYIFAYHDNCSQENNNATVSFDPEYLERIDGMNAQYLLLQLHCLLLMFKTENKNYLHAMLTRAGREASPTLFFAVHL